MERSEPNRERPAAGLRQDSAGGENGEASSKTRGGPVLVGRLVQWCSSYLDFDDRRYDRRRPPGFWGDPE